MRRRLAAAAAAVLALALPAAARAAEDPAPYRAHDYGGEPGFHDVLPPGENGSDNLVQLAAFLAAGERPPHSDDQLAMYANLVHAAPGVPAGELERYFKDSSFGVPAGRVERVEHPRDDVRIVRDSAFGVPHIYGDTRAALMFGTGYATAEDRLFFIDVLRHAGRAQLSSFAGGTEGNRVMDQQEWQVAPYTEQDLEQQITPTHEEIVRVFGPDRAPAIEQEVALVRSDAESYVAGINAYISEAKLDPLKMPGEYAAIGRPLGPDPWKLSDIVATAALVGGIFGKGGGNELTDARVYEAFVRRFGKRDAKRLFLDFRDPDDPEAPVTVHRRRFPYEVPPKRPRGVALPDPGSLDVVDTVAAATGAAAGDSAPAGGSPEVGRGAAHMSNALLVSARESQSGHPIAVMGPQVSYFAPEILMEEDLHSPAAPGVPAIDARGAAFPGVNLYVELGHGEDYAWSATSAGQDIIDTYAVDLCQDEHHYVFRGQCLPMERLERVNSWQPTLADSTPAGTETLVAERTKRGLVIARGTVDGRRVAFTSLRSTYQHEIDSALGFSEFNSPDIVHDARSFQRAASHVYYTFNWFYADDRDIAYFNSGANPRRPRHQSPFFPVLGEDPYQWRDWDADTNSARYLPARTHPQVRNQRFLTSWNNKQALGVTSSGFGEGPVYRSQSLDERIRRGIHGKRKMALIDLVNAMEGAATVDLRWRALRWALRIIGNPDDPGSPLGDSAVGSAVNKLRGWLETGAHRLDVDDDGDYEHAEAIRIADAWWPRLIRAEFEPKLGQQAFDALHSALPFDNAPNNDGAHLGSAYQDGWYSLVQKDLRDVLGQRVKGPFAREYCGLGSLSACRKALVDSLADALKHDSARELYGDEQCAAAGRNFDQTCFDAIGFRAVGAITQPLIDWQNRPTYQQAVEVQSHRPR